MSKGPALGGAFRCYHDYMRETRFGPRMLIVSLIVGLIFLGFITALAYFIASFTPAPLPVTLLLVALFLYWMCKSEHDAWWRPRPDGEPPPEGDRSPLVPRPPLLAASAKQSWPDQD